MCLSAYVRAHQYPAARKTHGVHMRTYALISIRPRGKRMESTCVRTRKYVFGRVENARSPHRPRGKCVESTCVRTHSTASAIRGILSPYARERTHDVTPLRTYATSSTFTAILNHIVLKSKQANQNEAKCYCLQ
jgi:hypothetical protein